MGETTCTRHCDHLGHQWTNLTGAHRTFVCCHCGRERVERVQSTGGRSWKFDRREHGPHLPDVTPMWGAPFTGNTEGDHV